MNNRYERGAVNTALAAFLPLVLVGAALFVGWMIISSTGQSQADEAGYEFQEVLITDEGFVPEPDRADVGDPSCVISSRLSRNAPIQLPSVTVQDVEHVVVNQLLLLA